MSESNAGCVAAAAQPARRLLGWLIAGHLVATLSLAAEQGSDLRLRGLSLAQALARLQAASELEIVFSDNLVRPGMVVAEEPTAEVPLEILEQILAPHGLAVRPGAGGRVVVVRGAEAPGAIAGVVRESMSFESVAGARVSIVGTPRQTVCDAGGRFRFGSVAPGRYTLQASLSGVAATAPKEVVVRAGETEGVVLEVSIVAADEIVITPSRSRVSSDEPVVATVLDADQLENLPVAGADPVRAAALLPGVSGGDFSARFSLRGGRPDEVLVMLDGLELFEPYHLKDLESPFSIISPEAVGQLDLISGGFPASYGDRMGGVLKLTTRDAGPGPRGYFALSTLSTGVGGSNRFATGRGEWLVSARRGLLDVAEKYAGVEEAPHYWDLFGRLSLQLSPRQTLSARWLGAEDELDLRDVAAGSEELTSTRYSSSYGWLGHDFVAGDRLFFETTASLGRVDHDRAGTLLGTQREFRVEDRWALDFVAINHQGRWQPSSRTLLHWGVHVRDLETGYDYFSRQELAAGSRASVDEIDFLDRIEGRQFGLFVSQKQRLARALTVEVGVRYDENEPLEESYASPRASLAWAVGSAGVVRASWGYFYQSQRANELQVEDGETAFQPSERSNQLLLGYEHGFDSGLRLRATAQASAITSPRVRYENLIDPVSRFPELELDRVRIAPEEARSRSLELLVQRRLDRLSWWASYVYSSIEDRLAGAWVKRGTDQPHALEVHMERRLGDSWSLGLTGEYHSGWPATPFSFDAGEGEPAAAPVFGALYSDRRPDYARIDVRIGRTWRLGGRELRAYADVLNAINRSNVRGFEIGPTEDPARPDAEPGLGVLGTKAWLPRVAILGLRLSL